MTEYLISTENLKTYTVDEVAQWLCQVGYRDYTAKFLERGVNGKKLLELQEFQLNGYFSSNTEKRTSFWNLLEAVRSNNQLHKSEPNMFSRGGGRPPPPRPHKSMPHFSTNNGSGRPYQPPPSQQDFQPRNPNPIQDYNYDSFSDDDEAYMDDVDIIPPAPRSHGPGHQPYRKSGEFPSAFRNDVRLPLTSPHEARSFSVDFTNQPPMISRKPRPSLPSYTPVHLKTNMPHSGPPLPSRPPILPGDGPAVDDQDAYLSFEEPPANPPGIHHQPLPRRPPAPLPSQPLGVDQGPPIPQRSPVRSPYDDHKLPDRPPPPPPSFSPTSPHPFSTVPKRTGSDKTDSSHSSPGPSRESSWKQNKSQFPHDFPTQSDIFHHTKSRAANKSNDSGHGSPGSSRETSSKSNSRIPMVSSFPNRAHSASTESHDSGNSSPVTSRGPSYKSQGFALPIAHLPSRHNNNSTGSNSSTSSDDLTKPPVTNNNFTAMKDNRLPRFPPIPQGGRSSSIPMPKFTTAEPDIEDQPWFQDVDRHVATARIEKYQENGMFIIRPRKESDTEPYALSVWAAGKNWNFKIRKRHDGEFALGTEKEGEAHASSVIRLVEYYQNNDIVLQNNKDNVKLTRSPPT